MSNGSVFGNLGDFALDRDRSAGRGAPLELGGGRGLWVRQAGGFNRRYEHALARRFREIGILDDPDSLELRDAAERATVEVVAAELLVGWWGIVDTEGRELDYTPELGAACLTEHPGLLDRVLEFAKREEEYRLAADTKSPRAVAAVA